MPRRTKKLIEKLKSWCDQEYGRRSKAAKALDVSPQAITDWLSDRRQPTAEQILIVQDFLAKVEGNERSRMPQDRV
jgi:hypothetical protein